ncbi:hypothetical protein SCHPADRAFT_893205 [Schizopora paradoxa]|uniref:Uncharacterized protein n=1 Tax=Schizopora paradoxa TaxID=27342 RepID=A0A0H2RBN8_9AGAM|nr:hypothetical protein SCHPADRAFT_893205 [Schizopora paradoxa]
MDFGWMSEDVLEADVLEDTPNLATTLHPSSRLQDFVAPFLAFGRSTPSLFSVSQSRHSFKLTTFPYLLCADKFERRLRQRLQVQFSAILHPVVQNPFILEDDHSRTREKEEIHQIDALSSCHSRNTEADDASLTSRSSSSLFRRDGAVSSYDITRVFHRRSVLAGWAKSQDPPPTITSKSVSDRAHFVDLRKSALDGVEGLEEIYMYRPTSPPSHFLSLRPHTSSVRRKDPGTRIALGSYRRN